MLEKIKELEKTAKLLETTEVLRKEWAAHVLRYAHDFYKKLNDSKAFRFSEDNGRGIYNLGITEEGTEIPLLLENIKQHIDGPGINPASGGYLAYIPGGGLYPSALGDFLAAVSNRYAGVFYGGPGAVRMENMLIRWMCRLMGYPENAFGNLTSGGSVSNLTAIVTAREAHHIKARDIEKTVIYLSEQAHHSMKKAIRIAGLSEAVFRLIPMDENLRIVPEALKKIIVADKEKGLYPFFVMASIGTTNTGAVDPIDEIAAIAEEFGLWLHVDAAYGGFFKLVPETAIKFKGVERSDSIALDPHKTLFLPYGTGAVLVRNREHLLNAFRASADYMQDTLSADEEISPADVSPELTKHFRGLRMWLPLKLFGLKPFRAALEEKLYLCRYFYEEIGKIKGFERGPEPDLSVTIFRYIPENKDANEFNKKLIHTIQQDGRIFLSSTRIDGKFWIRVAVIVFRAHLEHIDQLLEIIREKTTELES